MPADDPTRGWYPDIGRTVETDLPTRREFRRPMAEMNRETFLVALVLVGFLLSVLLCVSVVVVVVRLIS
jgi:hypothetical protein